MKCFVEISIMRSRYTRMLLMMVALFLSGCAHQKPWLSAISGLPQHVELEQVPFVSQGANKYLCGPESLAIALGVAGIPSSVEALSTQVYLPGREGSLQIEMLAAARRNGALAIMLTPRMDSLLRELAAGQPVLVLLNLSFQVAPVWHYAVVIGYDLPMQQIVLRSGNERRLLMSFTSFENTWERSQRWGFTVNMPDKIPVTATEKDAQQALLAFERVAAPKAAANAYEAAIQRWPGNAVLHMGLGNSLHAAGEKVKAARVYEQIAREKNSGAAWVNLAMTYAELGYKAEAQNAAQHALKQGEPWAARVQGLLKIIEADTTTKK